MCAPIIYLLLEAHLHYWNQILDQLTKAAGRIDELKISHFGQWSFCDGALLLCFLKPQLEWWVMPVCACSFKVTKAINSAPDSLQKRTDWRQSLLLIDSLQKPKCLFQDLRKENSPPHLSTISVLHLSSKCKHLRKKKSAMPECYSEQSRNQGKTSLDKAPRRKLYSTFNCWVNSLHSIKITGDNLDVRFT